MNLKAGLLSFFSICCVLTVFWALTQTQHSSENPRGWGAAPTLDSSGRYQPELVWARVCWGRPDQESTPANRLGLICLSASQGLGHHMVTQANKAIAS